MMEPLGIYDSGRKQNAACIGVRGACERMQFPMYISVKSKIVCENDHEIPQSQTTDKPMAPRGRATQQSRDTMKTRMDIR